MAKDARDASFYAFIIANTPTSSSRIRRFCVGKRSLRVLAFIAITAFCGSLYGFYGLTQQAAHWKTEIENQRLREQRDVRSLRPPSTFRDRQLEAGDRAKPELLRCTRELHHPEHPVVVGQRQRAMALLLRQLHNLIDA